MELDTESHDGDGLDICNSLGEEGSGRLETFRTGNDNDDDKYLGRFYCVSGPVVSTWCV